LRDWPDQPSNRFCRQAWWKARFSCVLGSRFWRFLNPSTCDSYVGGSNGQWDDREDDLIALPLDAILNLSPPSVILSQAMGWPFLDRRFGAACTLGPGRLPLPTRLVAGLFILKHHAQRFDKERRAFGGKPWLSVLLRRGDISARSSLNGLSPAAWQRCACSTLAGEFFGRPRNGPRTGAGRYRDSCYRCRVATIRAGVPEELLPSGLLIRCNGAITTYEIGIAT
jgi:hypothetical protein